MANTSKYATLNIAAEDYEAVRKYCHEHNIVIKDAFSEAAKLWLAAKEKEKETLDK